MPKAHEVATELRKLADALDKNPKATINKPTVYFTHSSYGDGVKEQFLNLAKLLPRPIKKGNGYGGEDLTLTHGTEALNIYASVPKTVTCELVEPARPAKYRCISVLSEDEEETLTEA